MSIFNHLSPGKGAGRGLGPCGRGYRNRRNCFSNGFNHSRNTPLLKSDIQDQKTLLNRLEQIEEEKAHLLEMMKTIKEN